MPAPKSLTEGELLRRLGEELIYYGEQWDTPTRSLVVRQRLHNDVETVASDVRAVVRGRGAR